MCPEEETPAASPINSGIVPLSPSTNLRATVSRMQVCNAVCCHLSVSKSHVGIHAYSNQHYYLVGARKSQLFGLLIDGLAVHCSVVLHPWSIYPCQSMPHRTQLLDPREVRPNTILGPRKHAVSRHTTLSPNWYPTMPHHAKGW